jgi:hypothetical protein
MRLLIALVVWAGAIAGAAGLSSVVAAKAGKDQAAASFDASNVTAADPVSLFHPANLDKILAVERKHLGSEAEFNDFVLYPGYLSLTEVANGSDTNVYINANGKYEVLSTTDAAGNSRVFSLKHVGGASIDAVVQKIVTKAHFPLSQLHYLVIDGDPISHHLNWLVYPVRGTPVEYFETSGPHGHLLQLLKNSPAGPTPVR